jgi:hypothetical protein
MNPTEKTFLDILSVAAKHFISENRLRDKALVTWNSTIPDEYFKLSPNLHSYLEKSGFKIDEELLIEYAKIDRPVVSLRRFGSLVPEIKVLDEKFQSASTIRKVQRDGNFTAIFAFTTPALSATGDQAFLEVWIEDGRRSHMATWNWVHLKQSDSEWKVVTSCMHALS